MSTLAVNPVFTPNLEGLTLGKLISGLFAKREIRVGVSTPAYGEGVSKEVMVVHDDTNLQAHIVVTTDDTLGPLPDATIVHPALLPSLITSMIGKEAGRQALLAVLYWNFDQLDQSYQAVPEEAINNDGQPIALVNVYQPGFSHTAATMQDRMNDLCVMYGVATGDPRDIPEFQLARKQLRSSEVTTIGNYYARTVNTSHAVFETLRMIYLAGQNAVVYSDLGADRKWWIKEQQKFHGCIPAAIMKGYHGKNCSMRQFSNGIVELTTPIPTGV